MRTLCVFSLFVFLMQVYAVVGGQLKLIFLQMLYRHGDRSPLQLYPNDPNPESIWPEGLGALTLLGKRQHYGLGALFRYLYNDFITTNPREINATSSDYDRCIESAEANLASFYAPKEGFKFSENINWQPIPVHYFRGKMDRYLDTEAPCPRADEEVKRVLQSNESQTYFAERKENYNKISSLSGTPITNFTAIYNLYDTLMIEKKYNLFIPDWVPRYYEELKRGTDLYFYFHFGSPLLKRLRAGPTLKLMTEKMKSKIAGKLPYQKVQVYSSHDSNIAVILETLDLYNGQAPPYCSTIILELYSGDNNSNFIRLLYFNSTAPEKINQIPHVLVMKGCSEFCPLDYFINYVQPYFPDDWEEECKVSQ